MWFRWYAGVKDDKSTVDLAPDQTTIISVVLLAHYCLAIRDSKTKVKFF